EHCGFSSEEQMHCAFVRILRIPPREYRRRFVSSAIRHWLVVRVDGRVVWSCTQLGLVVVNGSLRGYPQMYHSCGGKDGQFEELVNYGAVDYVPDEWKTFQVRKDRNVVQERPQLPWR